MGDDRAPWKVAVVLAAALVGASLGAAGSRAPRLDPTVSGLSQRPAAVDSGRVPGRSGHRRGATAPRGGPMRPAGDDEPTRSSQARSNRDRDQAAAGTAGPVPAQSQRAAPVPGAPGPLLSDTWYASRAHEIYPTMTLASNDRILTGFRISVRATSGTTEAITVTNLRDNTSQSATFSRADRLYFVETRMGDDGVDGETNNGDDGFVLTDAQGHIIGR